MSKVYYVVQEQLLYGNWVKQPVHVCDDYCEAESLCQKLNTESKSDSFEVIEL